MNRNGTAAIAGFGPVERDSKIRTTGSARHARVNITHGTPAKEERIKSIWESDKLSSRQRKSKRGKRENFVTVKCQKLTCKQLIAFERATKN
ncbi:hypothetical protein [Enterobacter sp. N18-03635]|uniref:hypothetical protein n=1 Tax=Enterobacter sp. N18-03635 TaxID=2500132 RepID=UPI0013E2BE81|nr:hypothetical protein [Enterobacter sp. N18-03635]